MGIFDKNKFDSVKTERFCFTQVGISETKCSTLAQWFIVAQMFNLQRQPLFCQSVLVAAVSR